MSKFIRSFKHTIKFDGDTIEFTLETLKRADVIILTPMFSSVTKEITENEALILSGEVLDIVQPYVTEMNGLKDDDGNPVSIAEVFERQYFFEMLTELINVLLEKSNPNKIDEKGKPTPKSKKSKAS